jgi:hypothetical protein
MDALLSGSDSDQTLLPSNRPLLNRKPGTSSKPANVKPARKRTRKHNTGASDAMSGAAESALTC